MRHALDGSSGVIAGGGTQTKFPFGDGGPASDASLPQVGCLVSGPNQQLYVCERAKAHAMVVGTTTNVITSVNVTGSDGVDCPELPGLVAATKQHFGIAEFSVDKAYLTHENLAAIETTGAAPFIHFKVKRRISRCNCRRYSCRSGIGHHTGRWERR